jgi:formylglycine-generating enzyme required for sulfatase activity/tRNA A-37 threonylcarbamoyl transferase component Bud32
MDQPVERTVFVPRSSGGASATDMFNAGDIVGQYKIEKVLGAGGMGVVYLAQHMALKKKFAIKVLPAKIAQESPSFVGKFKREAEMVARLKDPHIVNVTDFGESQGKLYLVLEYVEGGTLEDWFKAHAPKDKGLPAADVLRIVGQVLRGLGHAHKAGIIHRDLKPANVLMEKTGEAKISDFGLARVAEEEEYRKAGGTASPFHGDSVSTTGAIVGTIDFMSPEARNMQPSDGRSDIWAVGIITYQLLTGKKPSGIATLASQIVPGLDPRWDKFLATCLAEKPANRFQTAAEALAALEQIGGKPARKSHPLLPVAAFVLLAAGGFAAWKFLAAPASEPVEAARPAGLTGAASVDQPRTQTGGATPAAVHPALRKLALTGLPAGAQVTYRGRSQTANASGRVVLEGPPAPLAIKVRAAGYLDWEGEVGQEPEAMEDTVPLELLPPHPVRFTGLPAGAKVTINNQTIDGDATGSATFELRPARLTVTAIAPRYLDFAQEVDIQPSTQSVGLTMAKIPPPPEVKVDLGDGTILKFKWIPPGSFSYGSRAGEPGLQRSDLPSTKAEIAAGFYLAETEMTQQQHLAITNKNPSSSRALGDSTRPVEQVSWRDLTGNGGVLDRLNAALGRQKFAYTADLPTEIEWEYACRAGTEGSYHDGHNYANDRDDPALSAIAHYLRGAGLAAPAPTGKLKANAWGLYDMHGNVAEWAYSVKGRKDPVLRGGYYKLGPVHCRSASRVELQSDTRPTDYTGYRLVLRPQEQ